MREIKFRYRVKNRKTNELFVFKTTIQDIEVRAFTPTPIGSWDWATLSRDLSTNLLDKNRQEIFEGDIWRWGKGNYEVKWYPDIGAFGLTFTNMEGLEDFYDLSISKFGEVIGNIYENPELCMEAKHEGIDNEIANEYRTHNPNEKWPGKRMGD